MAEPRRIQLKRTKGWKMPENTVSVARPKFGNPFVVGTPSPTTGKPMSARECLDWYERGLIAAAWAWIGGPLSYFHERQSAVYDAWESRAPNMACVGIELALSDLRGKNLACWCALDAKCHADVLLELANPPAKHGEQE